MLKYVIAAVAVIVGGTSAQASNVTVTPTNPNGWSNPFYENNPGSSATITNTAPRDGNGSLEQIGDRTREVFGSLYDMTSNLGDFKSFTDLSFSFMIDSNSMTSYDPLYTPALGIVVNAGGVKQQFTFEGAYNGLYNTISKGNWYSTSAASTFYMKGDPAGENHQMTLADWAGTYKTGAATVMGIYIGTGGGAGPLYHTFSDDVIANGVKYNFETDAVTASVPEPASWAMMVVGFGVIGGGLRSQRTRRTHMAFAA